MLKTLIIAEKSTQMREYARALGFTLKGEHYEKGDTILSCAAGHLLELAEDKNSNKESAQENLESLKISISQDKANYFTNSKSFNVNSKS